MEKPLEILKRLLILPKGAGIPVLFFICGISPLIGQSNKTYTFFELAPLAGDTSSSAVSINHTGLVTGYSANAEGRKRAVVWNLGIKPKSPVKPTQLPDLGGGFSEAFDINDLDEIVGQATTSSGQAHACVWNRYRAVSDLHTLYSSPLSTALAINNKQDIAGYRVDANLQPSILLIRKGGVEDWSANSNLTRASDINNLRSAIANEQNDSSNSAVLLKDLNAEKLDPLPNLPLAEAVSINMPGSIVGACSSEDSQVATLWQSAGNAPAALGTLGGPYSKALGINSFGLIVGASNIASSSGVPANVFYNNSGYTVSKTPPIVNELDRAFLWKSGSLSNLNLLTKPPKNCILQAATAINDFGDIAGYCNLGGNLRGFVLIPTAKTTPLLLAFPSHPESVYQTTEPIEIWLAANVKTKVVRVKVNGLDRATYSTIPYPLTINSLTAGVHTLEITIVDPNSKKLSATWLGSVTVE